MWPEQVTSHSHSEDPGPDEDSTRSGDAPATPQRRPGARARNFTGNVTPITARLRTRRGAVPRESDDVPGRAPIRHRSPWTEDHPSPRCVWASYCEGAHLYGGEALLLKGAYWGIALVPCLLNMAFSAGHVMTVRPSYFWGAVTTALLILLFAH